MCDGGLHHPPPPPRRRALLQGPHLQRKDLLLPQGHVRVARRRLQGFPHPHSRVVRGRWVRALAWPGLALAGSMHIQHQHQHQHVPSAMVGRPACAPLPVACPRGGCRAARACARTRATLRTSTKLNTTTTTTMTGSSCNTTRAGRYFSGVALGSVYVNRRDRPHAPTPPRPPLTLAHSPTHPPHPHDEWLACSGTCNDFVALCWCGRRYGGGADVAAGTPSTKLSGALQTATQAVYGATLLVGTYMVGAAQSCRTASTAMGRWGRGEPWRADERLPVLLLLPPPPPGKKKHNMQTRTAGGGGGGGEGMGASELALALRGHCICPTFELGH